MPQRPIRSVIAKQKILTATAEITVVDAARLMKKKSVGAVMVVKDNGRLAGIFTERDAVFRVLAEGRDPKTTRLSDVMTPQPQTITPEKPFGHALSSYRKCCPVGIFHANGTTKLNPPMDMVIRPDDQLVLLAEDDSSIKFGGTPAPVSPSG